MKHAKAVRSSTEHTRSVRFLPLKAQVTWSIRIQSVSAHTAEWLVCETCRKTQASTPVEDNTAIQKQHKVICKCEGWITDYQLVTKMRLHPSQNCSQTAENMIKVEHLKKSCREYKQVEEENNLFYTFTEYFSNFGRAAPDFVHLVSGLTETSTCGAPASLALVVQHHVVKQLCKWACSWFSNLSLNPGLTSGFQLPTQWNKIFKPRSQVWHDFKTHTGHFLPN